MSSRGRTTRRRHAIPAQRKLGFIGFGALALVLLLASIASVGQSSTAERNARNLGPIILSEHPPPPNAAPNGRAWGPADAPVQVIEYVDYECESCGYFARTYEAEVIATFAATGQVRFEIRNAPFHGQGSRNAAAAAYCAAEQNAFWPMHDTLFLNQPVIEGTGPQVFSAARLNEIAAKLGLDTVAFDACFGSGKYIAQVEADAAEVRRLGITGTPTFVINGQMYPALLSAGDLRQIIAEATPDSDMTP